MRKSRSVNKLAWNSSKKVGFGFQHPSTTDISYQNQPPQELNYDRFNYQQRFHYESNGVGSVGEKRVDLNSHKPIVEKDLEKFIPKYNFYPDKSPAKEF